jgi:ERF superfamily protein
MTQQLLPQQLPAPTDMLAIIDRATRDPAVDVDKLQRLLDIREIEANRASEKAFNTALVLAQGEMKPINANASNPQTRSKYATYDALDRECRPVYSKFGLAPSFNTEPTGDPNTILVTCLLGHRDGHSRRYQIPMPITTQGFRGQDMMTRTHATGSAYTYGKRYLLIGMFNLAIDDDDDGNAASRRAPQIRRDVRPMQNYQQDDAPIDHDPQTGEVLEPVEPFTIEMHGGTWGQFLEPLQRHILSARTIEEIDEWMLKNQDMLLKLKTDKPQLFRLFEKNIEPRKEELTR